MWKFLVVASGVYGFFLFETFTHLFLSGGVHGHSHDIEVCTVFEAIMSRVVHLLCIVCHELSIVFLLVDIMYCVMLTVMTYDCVIFHTLNSAFPAVTIAHCVV